MALKDVVGSLDELDGILEQYSANIRITSESETRVEKEIEVQGFTIPYWVDREKQEYGFDNIEREVAVVKPFSQYVDFKALFLDYIDIHAMLLPLANAIVQSYVEETKNTIGRPKISKNEDGFCIVYQIKEHLQERLFVVKDANEDGIYISGEFERVDGVKFGKGLHVTGFKYDEQEGLEEVDLPEELRAALMGELEVAEEPAEEPVEEEVAEEEVIEEEVTEEEVTEEETEEVEEVAEEEVAEEEAYEAEEELEIPDDDAYEEEPVYTEEEPVEPEIVSTSPQRDEELITQGNTIIVKTFVDIDEVVFIRFVIGINGRVIAIKDVAEEEMVRYGFTVPRISNAIKEYRKCGVVIDEDVAHWGVAKTQITDADQIKGLVQSVLDI